MATFSNRPVFWLQAFRGFAAIAVVFYHVGFISLIKNRPDFADGIFRYGHVGVDFFFVLSGFIIFYVHEKDFGQPARAPLYFLKRIFRIYPLLIFLTTLKIAYMFLSGSGVHEGKFNPNLIISSYLLLPPVGLNSGYVIDAAWTLSHEMLFYLIFLLAIWYGRHAMMIVAMTWAVGMVLFNSRWFSGDALVGFFFDPKNLEFIMGGIAAAMCRGSRWSWKCSVIIALVIGAGLLAGSASLREAIMFGFAFSALIFITSMGELKGWLRPPAAFLVFLGDASYSIYLSHAAVLTPLIIFSDRISHSPEIYQIFLACSAFFSIGIGCGVYFFAERHFTSFGGRKISEWKARGTLLAA